MHEINHMRYSTPDHPRAFPRSRYEVSHEAKALRAVMDTSIDIQPVPTTSVRDKRAPKYSLHLTWEY